MTAVVIGDEFDNIITAGYALGYADGYDQHDREIQAWLGVLRPVLAQAMLSELEAARTVDHQPCGRRCRKCSRCIHSLAWYGRGRRDYLGAGDLEEQHRIAASWALKDGRRVAA